MTITDEYVGRSGDWVSLIGGSTISPRGATGKTVLLLVGDGPRTAGNFALETILAGAGWLVVVRRLSDAEDYTGIDVVVMQYGNSLEDNGQYVHPPVGVVGVDTWRSIGMGDLGFADGVNAVEVVDAASALAAGVSGTFAPYVSPQFITWTTDLSANPDVVVTLPDLPGQAVIFGYEAGSDMPSRYATTRHVALGYHQDGFDVGLTADAASQLLAACDWAAASAYVALPVPVAPTGLAGAAGDTRTLSWAAADYAETYTVKRAEVMGGPYTDIQSGVSATTYTDNSQTAGTTYYYVVSAVNVAGEGPNSAELSVSPVASTNVAMLATSAEVSMWQTRSVSGPFKSAEDFTTNSPGHWDEMSAALSLDFTSARWTGPTDTNGDGSLVKGGLTNDPPGSVRRMAHDMMSAAYAAVTTTNNTVAAAIRDEIEWQATQTNLDYSNRTLWPLDYFDDLNPLFMHCVWVKDYVLAYDIVKGMGYSSATVEQWFLDLSELAEYEISRRMEALAFPDRQLGDYSNLTSWATTDLREVHRLADGTIISIPTVVLLFNNRRSNMIGMAGLTGALLDNAYYIAEFKRYMKEWVMFGNRTTTYGAIQDANRGNDGAPQLGFSYSLHGLEACLPAMEGLARKGDTELYEFSSSLGATQPTWGTNHLKTMEECIDGRLRWISREWPLQYTGSGEPPSSSVAGDQNYLVGSRYGAQTGGLEMVNDANFLYAAVYYNRQDWVDIVNRVGTPTGFTSPPQGIGNITGWRADWRNRFLRSLDANPHGSA